MNKQFLTHSNLNPVENEAVSLKGIRAIVDDGAHKSRTMSLSKGPVRPMTTMGNQRSIPTKAFTLTNGARPISPFLNNRLQGRKISATPAKERPKTGINPSAFNTINTKTRSKTPITGHERLKSMGAPENIKLEKNSTPQAYENLLSFPSSLQMNTN